jgi:cytochrome P450
MKVLRQEGQFPFSVLQLEWPLISFNHAVGSALMDEENGFFGQGQKWKRLRKFLQTDLLSPAAAKGYVSGMIQAAQLASKGLEDFRLEPNIFLMRSSFDMFSSMMFGEITGVANPKSNPDPLNVKFCNSTAEALGLVFPLMLKPHVSLLVKLGLKTSEYKNFEEQMNISRHIANAKLDAFWKKKELRNLNEAESISYYYRAIERFKADPDSISKEELGEIGGMILGASVDTTSSVLSWCIVHLAMNPSVQESLFEEISKNIKKYGGLSEAMLSKAASPFLHAVVRESHRMTPAIPMSLLKSNSLSDVEIHSVTIPKGSRIALDTYSLGMDPEYVPDYNIFRPERWLDGEVKKRAGTPAEMIDHPLYRDPFSAGSRKCPGSRVANYEVLVMVSQLLLDWKISFENDTILSLDDIQHFQALTVQPKIPELKVIPRA